MRRWRIVRSYSFFREMPEGARHQKKWTELTPERLSQICIIQRVDTDGIPAVIRAGYKTAVRIR